MHQSTIPIMVGYALKGGPTPALYPPDTKQLSILNLRAGNRSGGTINVGLVKSLDVANWELYTFIAAGTLTEVSDTTLAAGVVVATTTNDEGFIVGASEKFGFLGFTVSEAGASGTYAVQYWNGSGWSALTTIEVFTDLSSTGNGYVVFLPPVGWVAGGPTGANQDHFHVRVIHTTAPGDTASIDALWVGVMLDFYEGVGDNGVAQLRFGEEKPFLLGAKEGVYPYFSTAHANNYFGGYYSLV